MQFLAAQPTNKTAEKSVEKFQPPVTNRKPIVETLFGHTLTDNYRWLEDKTSPEVREWTQRQHQATIDYLAVAAPIIPGMKERIIDEIDRDVRSLPFFRRKKEFFYARKKGEKQLKLYINESGIPRLLFDPTVLDATGKTAISGLDFTRSADRVAVSVQIKGAEINTCYIVDVNSGKVLGEPLNNIFSFSWTFDEQHAYITIRNKEDIAAQKPLKTYRWKIGTLQNEAEFLIAPDDAKDNAYVFDTDDEDAHDNYTFYGKGDFYSGTFQIRKIGTTDKLSTVYSSDKYRATPSYHKGKFYFYTNHEAPNFKLMTVEASNPEFSNWKTLIPENETVLEEYEFTSDYIIVRDKKDVISRLFAYDYNGNRLRQIELPEIGNVLSMSCNKQSNTLYVTISTFTAPTKLYALDGKTLAWRFVYSEPTTLDCSNIESRIVFYTAKDGKRIPMFIHFKKGLKQDGSNPALLNGYGGFNIGITPGFIGMSSILIQRGFVVATAGIRGGDEYGETWHHEGMLDKKQNVFDDYVAAAEYLIREGYTKPEKLVASGRSNGGLLMGAIATQRPELFRAIVCGVPLLDMLRYHKFLIARYWIPEYGNPDKADDFEYLMKYSPYQNIQSDVNYPSMFVFAGENDTRVDPLHAKKFVAALQNRSAQKNAIMLYMEFDSGHGSGKSVEKQAEDIEIQYRFIISNTL
ncbi:prolyl oligopeptidase family serine peptidase [Ignavibacteria bacterium]